MNHASYTVYYSDQQMHNVYINNTFYIISTLHVSMHLHHLQGVWSLYFAKVTKLSKLLKLQLNEISRLQCSHDHCCMIKYSLLNINNYNMWKLFVWWLHIQSGQLYGCNPYASVSCMLVLSWSE
jgi:hypothetical protein